MQMRRFLSMQKFIGTLHKRVSDLEQESEARKAKRHKSDRNEKEKKPTKKKATAAAAKEPVKEAFTVPAALVNGATLPVI